MTAPYVPASTGTSALERVPRRLVKLLLVLQTVVSLLPLTTTVILITLAVRSTVLLGHWPIASQDDPKTIVPRDWFGDLLYVAMPYMLLASTVAVLAVPILSLLLRRFHPGRWTLYLVGTFLLGWLLLFMDPLRLWAWYWD